MTNSWVGFKRLILVDKVVECKNVISFYFKDSNEGILPKHKAGQFLPIKLITDDLRYKDKIRTYSLSMAPGENIYRISVKRNPKGLISNYLHDNLNVGDAILAATPCGLFAVKEKSSISHITFLSDGIGVTPLLSMMLGEVNKRPITLVESLKNSENHPFKEEIKALSDNNSIKKITLYSAPSEKDKEENIFDFKGIVNKEWILKNLDLNNSFYFCGSPIFIGSINDALIELGVPIENIHYESF